MADKQNQDCEMNGEDFSQDVSATNENGSSSAGTNGNDTASNGRDDDRYYKPLTILVASKCWNHRPYLHRYCANIPLM